MIRWYVIHWADARPEYVAGLERRHAPSPLTCAAMAAKAVVNSADWMPLYILARRTRSMVTVITTPSGVTRVVRHHGTGHTGFEQFIAERYPAARCSTCAVEMPADLRHLNLDFELAYVGLRKLWQLATDIPHRRQRDGRLSGSPNACACCAATWRTLEVNRRDPRAARRIVQARCARAAGAAGASSAPA